MSRPIDGDVLYQVEKLLDTNIVRQDKVAHELLEQVLYDIQHFPTLTPPNEWVSVEERLPEVDDSVLVHIIDTFDNRENIVITKYTIGLNLKMEWLGFEYNSFKVTHWMPLPAPPAKDENNT